jgi:activator of HSP90 ATPase
MDSKLCDRREFYARLASLLAGLGVAVAAFGSTIASEARVAGDKAGGKTVAGNEEISRAAESIHQEIVLKASRKRVYEALTNAEQFTKVMRLSKYPDDPAATISREPGGPFSLFGGHIVGRHVELVPNERIVQVWRAASWEAGAYSIVRFDLKEQADQTKIIFDHTGFPMGLAEHLLEGWNSNYWEPLKKYLA